jgi:uncharacterized damage-inducible protein DinB
MEGMITEVKHYLERIEDLRGQVQDLIRKLPAEALNWRPIEKSDDHAMNSLAMMATHVAGAEHFWIAEVIGQQPATRVREAEFQAEVGDAAELLTKLSATGEETRAILPALTAVDLDGRREIRGRTVTVRWAILHVIDHTALHLGHMQITYQLWQGGQGVDAPRWFRRLSP